MSKPKFMQFSIQQLQEYIENSKSFEEVLQKMQYNHPNDKRIIQSIRNYCDTLNINHSYLPNTIDTGTLKCPVCNQIKTKDNFYFSQGKLAQKPCKECVRKRQNDKYHNRKNWLNDYKAERKCQKCNCDKFYLLDICIHFQLLGNKSSLNYQLKTTCILSCPRFCESGVQGQLNQFPAQGLTKMKSRCRLI